jgi:DNA-binding transcriptional ArsR family regulator
METAVDQIFKAISDPTRRKIIHLLSQSPCSVKQLTSAFEISQPAVSQHLRELRASNLVAAQRVGVEQHYRLTPGPLGQVFRWVAQYRMLFDVSGHAWVLTGEAPPAQKPGKAGKSHGS